MKISTSLPAHVSLRALTLAAAAAALLAPGALAQGTDEQREACAPDAIKLCQDTIPDVPKTTACMKRHYAELTPRCRTAFDGAVGTGSSRNRAARREAPPASVAPEAAAPERTPGLHAYEAHVREICREGLVDAFTCRNTLDLLKLGE